MRVFTPERSADAHQPLRVHGNLDGLALLDPIESAGIRPDARRRRASFLPRPVRLSAEVLRPSRVLAVLVRCPRCWSRHLPGVGDIAFVEILRVLSLAQELEPLTGGAVGIFNIPQPFPTKLGYLLIAGPAADQ